MGLPFPLVGLHCLVLSEPVLHNWATFVVESWWVYGIFMLHVNVSLLVEWWQIVCHRVILLLVLGYYFVDVGRIPIEVFFRVFFVERSVAFGPGLWVVVVWRFGATFLLNNFTQSSLLDDLLFLAIPKVGFFAELLWLQRWTFLLQASGIILIVIPFRVVVVIFWVIGVDWSHLRLCQTGVWVGIGSIAPISCFLRVVNKMRLLEGIVNILFSGLMFLFVAKCRVGRTHIRVHSRQSYLAAYQETRFISVTGSIGEIMPIAMMVSWSQSKGRWEQWPLSERVA